MKQIIEEVLQAEEKAAAIGKEARAKAGQIRLAAEKEAAERVSEAKGQVRGIMQDVIDTARQEAERLRAERLAQADKDNEDLLKSRAETIEGLVDDIASIVLSTEREEKTA